MIYLLLSILSSTVIFTVFKLFDRFKINTFQAIVVNYVTACLSGIIASRSSTEITDIPSQSWFIFAVGLGLLFIVIFNLMAITTQRSGLSVVSVATKMSFVLPVIFGLWYFKEQLSILKLLGIVLALLAVYLVSIKRASGVKVSRRDLIFPVLVFLGSGIIDTSLKYLEHEHVPEADVAIFSSLIFASAATIGLIAIGYQGIRGRLQFSIKNILGGIALGVPNFFSVYFLVKALGTDLFDSSGIFTINNVAVVMVSTLVGILLFHEKLSFKNWIGVLCAILSIIFVALNVL